MQELSAGRFGGHYLMKKGTCKTPEDRCPNIRQWLLAAQDLLPVPLTHRATGLPLHLRAPKTTHTYTTTSSKNAHFQASPALNILQPLSCFLSLDFTTP